MAKPFPLWRFAVLGRAYCAAVVLLILCTCILLLPSFRESFRPNSGRQDQIYIAGRVVVRNNREPLSKSNGIPKIIYGR
jgi:hypothetical protein